MTYPIAPYELITSWENSLTLQQNPTIDRRNGGTEFRGTNFQINQNRELQEVKLIVTSLLAYKSIEEFLTERMGKPFYFDDGYFLCSVLAWAWTYLGDDVFEISCQLRQEFRP